jgi:hypothetical protein
MKDKDKKFAVNFAKTGKKNYPRPRKIAGEQ